MGFHEYQCSRKAVKDGWCKQHHPDAVAARAEKSRAAWEERRKKEPWYVLSEVKKELSDSLFEIERLNGIIKTVAADRDRFERAAVDWMTVYNGAKAEVERLTQGLKILAGEPDEKGHTHLAELHDVVACQAFAKRILAADKGGGK